MTSAKRAELIAAAHEAEAAEHRLALGKAARTTREWKAAAEHAHRELELANRRLEVALAIKPPIDRVRIAPPRKAGPDRAIAGAIASDWHVGEHVERAAVSGKNEYRPALAERRAHEFWRRLVRLVEIQRSGARIETLFLHLGGDLIGGYIHEDLKLTNELSPTEEIRFAKRLVTEGLEYVLDHGFERVIVACSYGNHGRCHDSETELLTASGWKRWESIRVGEMVATMNPKTGNAEWQELSDLYVDLYDGEMLQCNTRSADFCVTPRHRMLLFNANSRRREFIEMRELSDSTIGGRYFPKAAIGVSPELGGVSDDELRLLAWIATDGCYHRQRDGYTNVGIYQSKPQHVGDIRGLLDRLGVSYSIATRHRKPPIIKGVQVKTCLPETKFGIHRRSALRILGLLPDKKQLPEWMWRLSERQVDVFLSTLMDGDGSRRGGVYLGELHGAKAFLDQIQSLLIVNGISSRVRRTTRGDYALSIRGSKRMYINDFEKSVSRVRYKGVIWCGTVPNGTLITRRNGIPLISGNTNPGRPLVAAAARNSFEWMAYHDLADSFRRERRVSWHIASGPFLYVDLEGFIIRCTHGDTLRYQGGIGGLTIPLVKALHRWETAERAHLTLMGHWHQYLALPRAIVNGSLKGFDAWASHIGAEYEPPQQAFFLIDPRRRRRTVAEPVFVE